MGDFIATYFSNGMTLMIGTLLVLAIAYRYYSAFIAAKVLALDPLRQTPAHKLHDGQNYHATNKWVLFGHHFAAISGAGPLIGPVLAVQFGYMPGFLWILVGVCLAGAVQDFVILALSVRRGGKSLAQIAFLEIGPFAGTAATIGIMFVLVIALAGLGKVVTKALGGETIKYPTGTEFIGSPTANFSLVSEYDTTWRYRIPPGTIIRYKTGDVPVTTMLTVEFTGLNGTAPDRDRIIIPELGNGAATAPATAAAGARTPATRAAPPPATAAARGAPAARAGAARGARAAAGAATTPARGAAATPARGTAAAPARGAATQRAAGAATMLSTRFRYDVHMVVSDGVTAQSMIPGSTWGTFTIALTIPIALFIGWYLHRVRKGRVVEASIIGGLMTLAAVYAGGLLTGETFFSGSDMLNQAAAYVSGLQDSFNLTEGQVGYSMAIYGFVASVLPVWMLLCPRDYLSSFLKIGTVALLVVGVIFANPHLNAPAINTTFIGGGPVVPGAIFPFVFITIMCGAVSGFHALVSSGTTPKMLDNEADARRIGYGAMLIEGLVGIVALIAAAGLPTTHYYNINTANDSLPKYQQDIQKIAAADRLNQRAGEESLPDVGEHLQGRTGGAVTLAIGMAEIFDAAAHNILNVTAAKAAWLAELKKYWYHFAIMFEALFILTTIDTGTRVGRFLLQESMGKWIHPRLGKTDWWPSAIFSTALVVAGWWYFLQANAMAAIWPMFGISNQMLAVMALAIGTAAIARAGRRKYIAVTLVPMIFVAITTSSAAVLMLRKYVNEIMTLDRTITGNGAKVFNDVVSSGCIVAIVVCTAVVVIGAMASTFRGDIPEGGFPIAGEAPEMAAVNGTVLAKRDGA